MNEYNDRNYYSKMHDYKEQFWSVMRGKDKLMDIIKNGRDINIGTYILPESSKNKFNESIQKISLFRTLATVIPAYNGSTRINAKNCNDIAMWISEGADIPIYDGINDFTNIPIESFKLGVVTKLDLNFISDTSFDVETYLTERLANTFDKAEENAFINGNGVKQPTGILNSTNGAEIALTTSSVTYDDVVTLYFSVKSKYRKNGVWLMNDKTAMELRKLKDSMGNYLWRSSDDTILGKKVLISEYMPNTEKDNKAIAFGDFSYYWIIDRSPLSVRTLREKFVVLNQIGYLAFEFLDAKLIRNEAIKVIQLS